MAKKCHLLRGLRAHTLSLETKVAVLVANIMMGASANFRDEKTLQADGRRPRKTNRELMWARNDIAGVEKTASRVLVNSDLGTNSHATRDTLLQTTNPLIREA